eukprot:5622652-Pleurochrysis_carterae.AAC.1
MNETARARRACACVRTSAYLCASSCACARARSRAPVVGRQDGLVDVPGLLELGDGALPHLVLHLHLADELKHLRHFERTWGLLRVRAGGAYSWARTHLDAQGVAHMHATLARAWAQKGTRGCLLTRTTRASERGTGRAVTSNPTGSRVVAFGVRTGAAAHAPSARVRACSCEAGHLSKRASERACARA